MWCWNYKCAFIKDLNDLERGWCERCVRCTLTNELGLPLFLKLCVIASSWKYLKLHSREETSKIYTYIYKSLIELTSGEIKVIQTGVALFEAQSYVKRLHSMVELSLSTFNLQNVVLLWLAGFLSCFNYHTNFIGANCSSICSALRKKTLNILVYLFRRFLD